MLILLATAPLVLPALGAAVASLNPPEHLPSPYGAENSYSASHYQNEAFLVARIPCNGCRAYAGAFDDCGSSYVPNMRLETDLIFSIQIPPGKPGTLMVNDASIIPLGPNIALTAYQLPRDVETERFLFASIESDWKKLALGYDLMVHSARDSEESTQKQVTVRIRVTSVNGDRNDAIEEMEIVVIEDLQTKKLEMKSVSVRPLPGAPLVWLEEPGTTTPGPLEPVDVDIEIEMKGVPCGTNLGCILEAVRENLRKMRDAAFGNTPKDSTEDAAQPCHKEPEPEDMFHALPFDFDFPEPPVDEMLHHNYQSPEEGHDQGFGLLKTICQFMAPIFVGLAAGLAVSLFGLVLGQLFMIGRKRIQASRKHRRHHSRKCHHFAEARPMLSVPEEDQLPEYQDEGIEVAEKE